MNTAGIEPKEFDALRQFIRKVAGITLGPQKQHLLTGRLNPRLRALGLSSYSQYLDYLNNDRSGAETRELINCITTNKTSFFREPHHFDALKSKIIPELASKRKIRIWSSACSMGHEPWSMAMTIADALGGSFAGWDVKILASDLDTNVLATAERATYDEIAVADIPAAYRSKYLEPMPNGEFRIVKPLRDAVSFRCLNLVEPATWALRVKFDVIFCRNVAIYFDKPTQELVFKSLAAQLEPTGYLMSGHSENLHWLSGTLRAVGNTIHMLTDSASSLSPASSRAFPAAPPSSRQEPPASRQEPASSRQEPAPSSRFRAEPPASARAPESRLGRPQPQSATMQRVVPAAPALAMAGQGKEVSIQVGGIHASAKGAVLKTTLGSCVAACIYDPVTRIGGMNHFLLPEDKSGSRGPTNFGVHAMELLINSCMKLGGDRRRFVAKLFGGADQHNNGLVKVGKQNSEFALRYLEEEGIPVIGQKLGGNSAMMVVFDTAEGKALVKLIERSREIVNEEQNHMESLQRAMRPVEDDIVFFGTR